MVDGGFYRRRAYARLGDKSPKERADELESYCKRHLNEKIYGIQTSHRLYRIFYYDCLPVSKNIYNLLTKKDRKSTRLNSSHRCTSRMPSSA